MADILKQFAADFATEAARKAGRESLSASVHHLHSVMRVDQFSPPLKMICQDGGRVESSKHSLKLSLSLILNTGESETDCQTVFQAAKCQIRLGQQCYGSCSVIFLFHGKQIRVCLPNLMCTC